MWADKNCYSPLNRRHWLAAAALAPWLARAATVPPLTLAVPLRVGPKQSIQTLAEAARQAEDGSVIDVDGGDYVGDVATWPQNDLTLRAVGGRVRLLANGQSAQGKGLFVTTGERVRIEGFDFQGCTVPDQNGAGIRLERGSLFLRDCTFAANENGLLSSNDPNTRLEIEDCEFGPIVARQGQNHNLYVGAIAYLKVTGSYFHHGQFGHLLKSRAAVNHIFYNRLTDELGGQSSYELEFPNGGLALVVGNVVQKNTTPQNPHLISFGAEGYKTPRQGLWLVNNTLVDQRPGGGSYLGVAPRPEGVEIHLINNLFAGNPLLPLLAGADDRNNTYVSLDEFVAASRYNYALKPHSSLRGKFVDPGAADHVDLAITRQFQLPRGTMALRSKARNPGAIQSA